MKKIMFVVVFLLMGCSNQHVLPPDVSGDLQPINQEQVIDYDL